MACYSVRVFILGPSHHARLAGCALSGLEKYETPFYHLTVDSQGSYSNAFESLAIYLLLLAAPA